MRVKLNEENSPTGPETSRGFTEAIIRLSRPGDVTRAANGGKISYTQTLNDEGLSISRLFQPPVVVITIAANIGDTAVLDFPCCFPDSVIGLMPNDGTDACLGTHRCVQRSNTSTPRWRALHKADLHALREQTRNVGILKTLEMACSQLIAFNPDRRYPGVVAAVLETGKNGVLNHVLRGFPANGLAVQ